MKYRIAKRFKKDLDKINDRKVLVKVRKCIEAIGTSQTFSEIPELEPLEGFLGYYRIKSDYNIVLGFFGMEKLLKFLK